MNDWANRYPPLAAVALAVFIALAVLPSALNQPQTNPTRTLEYAPVPPNDRDTPPAQTGNLASLGLAGGSTLTKSGVTKPPPPSDEPPAGAPAGSGRNPTTKRCVGNPPRQTEDPLAPPCVANFSGDNFGSTYQGVTRDEVRVLVYAEGGITTVVTSQGGETAPQNVYVDLAQEPKNDDHYYVRMLRGWQRYFNDRYQTYGRFVHFYIYFNSTNGAATPEQRRADAADNFATIHPFAVLAYADFAGNADAYLQAMAERGVLNFGSYIGRPASFYQQYPKLVWGYQPSIEVQAHLFAAFVCREVVKPGVVTFGGPDVQGKKRVLGLLESADESKPGFAHFAEVVKQEVQGCGGTFATTQTFPSAGYIADSRHPPSYAATGAAAFQQAGVTTIIWPQGYETNYSAAANKISYTPEWVIAGDHTHEGNDSGSYQDQNEWAHARVVTTVPFVKPAADSICYREYRTADPDAPSQDVSLMCGAFTWYDDLGRLFTGIQVAGPRLTPTSVDRGMHAIPPIPSQSNDVPACFYEPNDYTCIKDGVLERYDPQCQATQTSRTGCWRMIEKGKRYFADGWPEGDLAGRDAPDDLPNTFTSGINLRGGAPDT